VNEQVIVDWCLQHLPPESGPVFSWVAGNYDIARPGLLFGFVTIVILEILVISFLARYFRG